MSAPLNRWIPLPKVTQLESAGLGAEPKKPSSRTTYCNHCAPRHLVLSHTGLEELADFRDHQN